MIKLHPLFLALAATGFVPSVQSAQSAPTSNVQQAAQGTIYIITFAEPGLMYNDGQQGRFLATAASPGSRKVDAKSFAAVSYLDYLESQQDAYLAEMGRVIARPVSPVHRYDITMNGIAAVLSAEEAERISLISGVASVKAEEIHEMVTDAGPTFIGAPSIWNGPGTYTGLGTRGEGVLVGVFDSGGNSDHPSFANDASCGFSAGTPKIVGTRDCNTATCSSGNGEDVSVFVNATDTGSSGHGVHTASTAVGAPVAAGTLVNGVPSAYNISGVAPCSRVITYKVCGTTASSGVAGCGSAAIAAAIQRSIVDQIDVMNFSISGGGSPWSDNDRGFLDMTNADILVAASAGNTRASVPNPVGNVAHRGPWVLTVANSTHDRVITNPVSVAGSLQNVASQASNGPAYPATVTAQVGNAVALGNEYGCTDSGGFAPGSMTGKIALIQRGPPAPGVACGFSEKINNAAAAGAIGAVIYDRTTGAPLSMDVTTAPGATLPAIFIRQSAGYALRDYLVTNPTALMTVVAPAQRVLDPNVADVLNTSSLRGPNLTFDVTKPDITGPGTNIYAASSDNFGQFITLTGTSMSSPHLAGSAALLRSAQPTWTVQEVKSALQLTASPIGRKDTEAAPWDADDVGNGRVDLTKAARAGLVMNETFANFLAANPSTAGANPVRQLNLPSMRHTSVAGSYVFTRTFRNAYGKAATWTANTAGAPAGTTVTVSPASFTFGDNAAQTQTVQITVTLNQALAAPTFGTVGFTPSSVAPSGDVIFEGGFELPTQTPNAVSLSLTVQGNP